MKRDMDLARAILLAVEETPAAEHWSAEPLLDHDIEDVIGHIHLLDDESLVDARYGACNDAVILRLTNAGHDFLEISRPLTRWEQAKKAALDKGLPMTIGVLKVTLNSIVQAALSHMSV